ncbi:hypothetical protein ALC53_06870 [Atta colombica]|uniref:Uncharacterized protein n=1 Tax=Atta colombica TaxID=520822 RepID=A0A195BEV3_9HYME|nr:PREDICTED: RING finger protein PFF0165c-like [Atta colombica]KYM82695.1 hypothetical protein ALC53_06870 [Atta colombica]
MKKILLATTLLLVCENILMENSPYHLLETAWLCDNQLWNRKIKRIPRADIPSETEESLNYDDRQFPRILDTRFISESRKLPPMAIIRRHDLARFDLSSDKSKLDNAKPRVLISIGIQEEKNADYDLQENCSTRKNYCKQNWQVQQPFYVEEPRWVDIDVDYIDSSNIDNSDPYVLTRGKKIYRINDLEQARKTIEATFNYPNKNKKLLIKRVRRFAETNEEFQNKTADEKNNRIKEKTHYDSFEDINRDTNNTAIIEIENTFEKPLEIDKSSENKKTESTYYVFNKKYEKADLKNLAKRSSRDFTKQNQISRNNHGTITKFIKQKEKIQREDTNDSRIEKIDQVKRFNNKKSHFVINNINKKFILLKNQLPKIRKKREIYDINFKKNVEKNETKIYEPMKNKDDVEKLNDFTSDNHFILSQNKDLINGGIEGLNKIDIDRNKFIEKTWKFHYAHHKKLEESKKEAKNKENKSEINNNIGITDSQLINEYNSKNSERKISNDRDKRNICKDCQITSKFQENERLKEIEKKIQMSLERRDKHSDILEHLSQSEPYIISRGKKMLQDFEMKDLFSNPRNMNDENRARMINPIAKSLRTLLIEISRCNDNFNIKANELSNQRLSPRDRRGTLDEILAAYDPYYVVRGKRMNQNQKNVLFETDTTQ